MGWMGWGVTYTPQEKRSKELLSKIKKFYFKMEFHKSIGQKVLLGPQDKIEQGSPDEY